MRGAAVSSVCQVALGVADERVDQLGLLARRAGPTAALCSKYIPSFSLPTGPEMMSGVRASSMSTESTSSTIAYDVRPLHALVERTTMLSRR